MLSWPGSNPAHGHQVKPNSCWEGSHVPFLCIVFVLFLFAVSLSSHFYAFCHHFSCIISLFQGWGVLGISSDRDDQRMFLGLKFSMSGFFWVRKCWQVFFGVAWLKSGFLWVFKKSEVSCYGVVAVYTQPCCSLNKVKQNLCCDCFCFLEIFLAWKFGMGFLGGYILVQGFFGFVWRPRDFFGFWFLFLFDHPLPGFEAMSCVKILPL